MARSDLSTGLDFAARELRYFIFSSMDEPALPWMKTLLVNPDFCSLTGGFLPAHHCPCIFSILRLFP